MGTYELKTASDGQYMWNLKAGNHEIILTSETYKSKESALNGVESVRKNSPDDARYVRKTSKDGQHFFVLTATNGQTIGRSELYTATGGMENGIKSVKSNGPGATLKEI